MHLFITIPLLIVAFIIIATIAREEHRKAVERVRKEFPGPKHARSFPCRRYKAWDGKDCTRPYGHDDECEYREDPRPYHPSDSFRTRMPMRWED